MSLNSRLSAALKKKWTPEHIAMMLGPHQAAHLGHATDECLRELSASGGVVTALLVHLLETDRIDAALVCRIVIEDGCVRPGFVLAHTAEDILAARGSVYVATRFAADALPLLRESTGRVAVVGLPCDLAVLDRAMGGDPDLAARVRLKIALICGHSSRPELVDTITSRLEKKAHAPLTGFQFRVGHWRGKLRASFENGIVIERPSAYYNLYQNLYFHADKKCMYCDDHFGRHSDISAGDVWSYHLKDDPVKHTGLLVRTDRGADAIGSAESARAVVLAPLAGEEILDGQARTAPFHYNTSARARAGKLVGMKIPDTVNAPVRWNEWLAALIILVNYRITSRPRLARIVLALPRPLLKAYLYLLKGIQSL